MTDSNDKNLKKITELENVITRMKIVQNDSKVIASSDRKEEVTAAPFKEPLGKKVPSKIRCKFENTGNCRTKSCQDLHLKKTCQMHSKYGSCHFESTCEHRHPHGVCYK